MYQRIIVATGGSPWSEAAVSAAIALAARVGAELRILTVVARTEEANAADRPADADRALAGIEKRKNELLTHAATHAARARVVYTTHAARGGIPATILQTADDEDCDLIVMGARQPGGGYRQTLGSIVNAVAVQATQPVLVIKATPSPAALLSQRLLVATGGSPWSEAAVAHAARLAQSLQLEVCVLHVEGELAQHQHNVPTVAGPQLLSQAVEQATALGVKADKTLASGLAAEAILSTATSTHCDTIVLGSRGVTGWPRPRLGALVNTVAARTPLPVLIVKRFLSLAPA